MTFARPLIAATVLAFSSSLLAGANCPEAPESQWIHILDMQKKIVNEYGFAIKKFQKSGNCYEIYGFDKDGKKVEIYFDPVSGKPVKSNVEG